MSKTLDPNKKYKVIDNDLVNGYIILTGYTEKELHMAFDLVCSKSHWKEGGRVKLSKTILDNYSDVIESAVIFFTGGGCEFYYTGEKRKTYWCEFAGYWANGMEG